VNNKQTSSEGGKEVIISERICGAGGEQREGDELGDV